MTSCRLSSWIDPTRAIVIASVNHEADYGYVSSSWNCSTSPSTVGVLRVHRCPWTHEYYTGDLLTLQQGVIRRVAAHRVRCSRRIQHVNWTKSVGKSGTHFPVRRRSFALEYGCYKNHSVWCVGGVSCLVNTLRWSFLPTNGALVEWIYQGTESFSVHRSFQILADVYLPFEFQVSKFYKSGFSSFPIFNQHGTRHICVEKYLYGAIWPGGWSKLPSVEVSVRRGASGASPVRKKVRLREVLPTGFSYLFFRSTLVRVPVPLNSIIRVSVVFGAIPTHSEIFGSIFERAYI